MKKLIAFLLMVSCIGSLPAQVLNKYTKDPTWITAGIMNLLNYQQNILKLSRDFNATDANSMRITKAAF